MKNTKKLWAGLLVVPAVVLVGCSDGANKVVEPMDLPPAPPVIEQPAAVDVSGVSGEIYDTVTPTVGVIGDDAPAKVRALMQESQRIQQDASLTKEQKMTALEDIQARIREVAKDATMQ